MRIALTFLVAFATAAAGAQSIESGAIALSYKPGRGAAIDFSEVPLSRGNSLQLHAPDWSKSFYSSNGEPPEAKTADQQIVAQHSARKVRFHATETYRLTAPNRLKIELSAQLDSDVQADAEWTLGFLNAFPFYGGRCGKYEIVPQPSKARTPPAIESNAAVIKFQGRLGQITIRIDKGPARLTVLDGRRTPDSWWMQDQPSFWIGVQGLRIKPREPLEIVATIEFALAEQKPPAPPMAATARALPTSRVIVPASQPINIIPKPRQLKWMDGRVALGAQTKLFAPNEALAGVKVLQREVKERFGWDGQVSDRPTSGGISFQSADLADEAYRIECAPEKIVLSAHGPIGWFYAAQTLCQLISFDSTGVWAPACAIDDSPSLPFRGVHIFTGKDAMPLHRKLVERIFARYKLNHLVIECDYTQWDTDRKIWTDISMPKEQLAQYVKVARENFLEPIPLVQSLGHAQWMFKNDANRDLAEYPDRPYAYSVTNPRTYEFIRKIYAEALEVFQPKYFHIGHDEVNIFGKYPWREEAKQWGETKLFTHDVAQHDAQMRAKSVKLMLWGDMLLHRSECNDPAANAASVEEAKARRAAMPKDAVIADWHYQPAKPEAYNSLKVFKDAGFKTLACTWYNPANIYNFASAARIYGAWGLLQTTWAGYSITDQTIDREAKQFAAYILAAEYAWSGDSPEPAKLPYRPEDIFARAMNPQREIIRPRPGAQLDLSAAANLELLPGAPIGNIAFALTEKPRTIVLAGKLLPDAVKASRSVKLDTNLICGELCFLHTTLAPAALGEVVASYGIEYDDAAHERVDLHYGREIRALDDPAPCSRASVGFSQRRTDGIERVMRIFRWQNPTPVKRVKRIVFSSEHPYASAMLAGVTGIADE